MATETDKTYNGWTNYETWCVKLWMDNEEMSYRSWQGKAREFYEDAEKDRNFTKRERAEINLADHMKAAYEDSNPLSDRADVWCDLLRASLSEVNWGEIAGALLDDVTDDADRDDESEE